ncbi:MULTISPECIES: MupA/Atu3671 family FMN-dependent luciferase-like monooxygenase [Streptomyces]|uniref:MupA/Atu3671 family FMN-dependent luciferase-like monooxygenase n=1 Tax=Streptomyces TaxID=1883 RepID=UPI003449637A
MTQTSQDVLSLIARHIGRTVGELDLDRTFVASGADSLALMALARELESGSGVRVPVRELFEGADTPRGLLTLLSVPEAPDGDGTADRTPPAEPAGNTELVGSTGPAGSTEPAEPTKDVCAVIDGQLRLAESMLEKFTELAGEQLRALEDLRRDPPAGPGGDEGLPECPTDRAPRRPQAAPTGSAPPRSVTERPVARPQPRPSPQAAAGRPDFSLYFFGDYTDPDATAGYRHLMDAATFADDHGFHAIWIPERHFHSFGALFPSPAVLAASLAARTSRIRLHAGSVVLPLHNPLRVAEEWSVIDNLSGGRVGLGFASGWHSRDFVLAPENYGRQREILHEHLDTFQELWAGRAVRAASGTGEQVEVRLHPRPVQEAPPLFLAVLSNPESYERAGAAGLGVVTNLMTQSVDDLRDNIARYRRARAAHGFDPAGGRVTVLVHTYLGADAERAVRQAHRPFRDYLRSSLQLLDTMANSLGLDVDLSATPPEDLDFVLDRAYDQYRATRALIGSPASVRPVLDSLVDAGVDEVGCFIDFGVEPGLMLDALPHLDELRRCYTAPEPGPSLPPAAVAPLPEQAACSAPASALQRRMWLLDRIRPGQHTYHEPKALLLEGPLDLDALRVALRRTVDRHPQLRTVFRERSHDGVLEQVVPAPLAVDCPVVDLTGLDDDAALERMRDDEDLLDFDLARGPLLRAKLGRLAEDRHLLYLVAHHIVFDALSTPVFCQDLTAFYRAWPGEPEDLVEPGSGEVPEPEPAAVERSLAFWKRELDGVAPLELPTDRCRQNTAPVVGATLEHVLDPGLSQEVRTFSRAGNCTVFMTLLGAVGAVLGRFAGQDDVVLGTAVNRRPQSAGHAVGMFVETAALRIDLSGDPAFEALVHRVRSRLSTAIEHLEAPFDQVVEAVNPTRAAGGNPLFRAMVEFENETALDFSGTGLAARLLDVPRKQAPFDLSFYFADRSDGIRCAVEYDTGLFDEDTVRRVVEYVVDLLRHAVAAPDRPLSLLPSLTSRDAQDLARWQGRRTEADAACLHELFEEQALARPDALALTGDGEPMSYGTLDAAANRLAHRLAERGLACGDRAAVCVPRGAGLVVAILAVLKCGAAYVPLDRSLPAERRRFMLEDSAAELVIADRAAEEGSEHGLAGSDGTLPCPVQWLDDVEPGLPEAPLGVPVRPDDTAYHLYTSGTSGRPKAVAVPHRGPVNLIRWQTATLGALRTVQWASAGFDVSVQEIFATLASGAALVLLDDETRYDPAAVAEHLRQHEVQRMSVPYTPLKHLARELAHVPSLRQLLVGGERLVITPELRALAEANPQLEIHNHYGPTETSVVVISHRVDPLTETVPPIGRPVDNVMLRVLDDHGRDVPVGVPGELLIGGVQVARGYFGRPALTAERFGAKAAGPAGGPAAGDSPGGRGAEERFYRTGDLVRLRNDGTVEYLGRIDGQVKIRGNRVEPDEAGRVLAGLPGVREAVVLARPDHTGESELAAYVVLDDPAPADEDWSTPLRSRLAATLPHYLIPQSWRRLDRVPYTAHGKLDRAALLALGGGAAGAPVSAGTGAPDAATDTGGAAGPQEVLRKLWAMELGDRVAAGVPVDRSFFDVGGNSLSAVRLLERIRSEFGLRIPVAEFFGSPTLQALTERLRQEAA